MTLDTLRSMIPTTRFSAVTNEHPKSSTGIALDVTRETAKDLAAGHVGGEADVELVETGEGEGFIKVRFVVDDPDTIDLVDDKVLSELSPKYRTEYLASPGEHPLHGKYDGIQKTRDVNAVALTRKGRGSAVFVRADSAYEESPMDKEHADQEATMSDELISKLADKLVERLSALMAKGEKAPAEEAPAEEAAADEAMEEAAADEAPAEEAAADEAMEEAVTEDAADEHVEGHTSEAAPAEKASEGEDEETITIPKAKYEQMMAELGSDSYKDKADSAFLQAFERRSRIIDAARGQGVALSDVDMSMPNDSLLAKVAKSLLPTGMHDRADSDAGFCEGVLFASETHDSRHDGLGSGAGAPNRAAKDIDPWEAGLRMRQESQ